MNWKIGASNEAAQKMLGFGPFYGPLFAKNFVSSKDVVTMKSFINFIAVEVEVAFELNDEIPVKTDGTEYSVEEVWGFVDNIIPAIELAASRVTGKRSHGATAADFALNGCVLLHEKINKNLFVNYDSLANITVSISVNNEEKAASSGANVMGNPIFALTWLVNSLVSKNISLCKGDIIMSGCVVMSKDVPGGSVVTASMGSFDTTEACDDVTFELQTK